MRLSRLEIETLLSLCSIHISEFEKAGNVFPDVGHYLASLAGKFQGLLETREMEFTLTFAKDEQNGSF